MFCQLRITFNLEDHLRYGNRHDEDVGDFRFDRRLHLFDESPRKSLDYRIVRIDVEQIRKVR